MHTIIQARTADLTTLCDQHGVQRLAVFGSAAEDDFRPLSSDLDFLVEFQPMPPTRHADHYFGLLEDLERLFGRPVDLVEPNAIRNPYIRQAVARQQVVVYDHP